MPFVGPSMVKIEPRGSKVKQSKRETDKAKSIAMALMKRQGRTFREIGGFFNVHHRTVQKRVAKVPAGDLQLYA